MAIQTFEQLEKAFGYDCVLEMRKKVENINIVWPVDTDGVLEQN